MLTVVFTTFNGQSKIRRTLDSLVRQKIESKWELLVVNNNSTDGTVSILEEYLDKLPLKILHESRQGKNIALNSAIPYINGELVLFTDDDVRGEDNWLANSVLVATEMKEHSIFAGHILPEWEEEPESWIINWAPLGALYALNSQSEKNIACLPGQVWGPNMLIRREVIFDNGLYFDENIGPNGTDFYPMGSETEFTKRAAEYGYSCFISDKFKVYHLISKSSLCKSWILKRGERLGIGVTMANVKKFDITKFLEYYCKSKTYSLLGMFSLIFWNKKVFWVLYKKYYYGGCLKVIKNLYK